MITFTTETPSQLCLLPLPQQEWQTLVETAELDLTRHAEDNTVPFYTNKVISASLHILVFFFLLLLWLLHPKYISQCLLLNQQQLSFHFLRWRFLDPSATFVLVHWQEAEEEEEMRANVMCILSAGLSIIFARPRSFKRMVSLTLNIFVHLLLC